MRNLLFNEPGNRLELCLSGPEGNAFYLLAVARNLAPQIQLDAQKITEEMKAGDYGHLVETFEKYFSDYVEIKP